MKLLKLSMSLLALSISLSFSGKAQANKIMSDMPVAGISNTIYEYEQATSNPEIEVKDLLVKSEFDGKGFSIANEYVNIRSLANTESEVVGKLYRGSMANIIETTGDWVKIKSGSVEGYIKSEFLVIGKEAEKFADDFTEKIATINTETLYVRAEQSKESSITTMVPFGETFYVNEEYDEWAHIMIDELEAGYVSKEYITISFKYKYAISIEEEQARLAVEQASREAEQRQQEAYRRQQESANKAAAQVKATASSSSSSKNQTKTTSSTFTTGQQIASYAKQFVGNPYVWGGTSLTNGADCSGFVQAIYKHFGYSITRVSADQAVSAGRKISLSELQPGDLIFYSSNGRVNHVAMYIGDGKVVHASNARDGIKISNYNYRTPSSARRVI